MKLELWCYRYMFCCCWLCPSTVLCLTTPLCAPQIWSQALCAHGGSVVSTVASQQEGPWFKPRSFQVLSVWSLHGLPVPAWVSSRYSGFPHHHKDMHRMNVGGGRSGRRCWLAATLLSVCPRAAVATVVTYHHRYDCLNEYWTIKLYFVQDWGGRKGEYSNADYKLQEIYI